MNGFSTTAWWPIACLDCGVNADLLTDERTRIICRECHKKHEFNFCKDAIGNIPEGGSATEEVFGDEAMAIHSSAICSIRSCDHCREEKRNGPNRKSTKGEKQ
jgi:hypothetical protein